MFIKATAKTIFVRNKNSKIRNITKRWIFSRCVLYIYAISIALLLRYFGSSRGIYYVDSERQKPLTQSREIYPRRKNFSVRNHVLLPCLSTQQYGWSLLRDKKNSKKLFSLSGAWFFVTLLTRSRHWSLIRLTSSTISWRFALIFSSSLCLNFQNTPIQTTETFITYHFILVSSVIKVTSNFRMIGVGLSVVTVIFISRSLCP